MTATSTHDTKRGEDARARLSMLSELPNTWRQTVRDLQRLASAYRGSLQGKEAPTRGDQYLYFQSLIGVAPFGADAASLSALKPRLQAYVVKACREAKQHSSWLHPDAEYEAALQAFVAQTLDDSAFVARALRFCRRIEPYAVSKALGQVTLKLCAPGIPDTYQGAEDWHQVLVDPDNRRLVDFASLDARLSMLEAEPGRSPRSVRDLLEQYADGKIKLFVLRELLALRRARPELFQTGYVALDGGDDCIVFGRGNEGLCDLVCAVPRFPFRSTRGRTRWATGSLWAERAVTGAGLRGDYRDVFTGARVSGDGSLSLARVFAELPFAVLVR